MLKKTIDFELTAKSINKAVKEIGQFEKQLREICNDLIRELTEQGAVIAKMNVMSLNAVYTGALEESIKGVFYPEQRMGMIFTDVPYAMFVEYGTGIYGEQFPHPEAETAGWEYDVNGHGTSGWWYLGNFDGTWKLKWTMGMPSRPFMYNTLRWLQDNVDRIAEGKFQ